MGSRRAVPPFRGPRSKTRPVSEFGVYVHIPFCASRCDYCDFATWTDRAHLVDDYVEACVRDIERRDLPPATSVFFGGGTPSLLAADALVRILDAIPRAADAEVTVECNPDSVDADKLAAYAAGGVNRLSFGVQSMRAHVLAALGRTHDPANVERAVSWARDAGFTRINLDLIYGTPGERVADWEATLDAALALGPSHVSAYALTVEPGTPLGRAVAAGGPTGARRRRPGRQVRDRRRPAAGGRVRLVRGLELVAPGRGVPPQPPLLGPGRLRGDRLRRPRPYLPETVVERSDARALHRRGRRRCHRGGGV